MVKYKMHEQFQLVECLCQTRCEFHMKYEKREGMLVK